jgi:hypothetical protein|tara:strand:+ start:302 stop:1021 length:720 start_codon:yes stop_codon:yes gene_type:complete
MKNILLLLIVIPGLIYSQNYQNRGASIDYDICGMCEQPTYKIIGWSKEGNIAYLKNTEFGGYGGCKYELVILNLATDKVLNKSFLGGDSPREHQASENACDIDYLWRKKQKSINDLLGYYEITNDFFGGIKEQNRIESSTGLYSFKLSSTVLSTYDNYECEGVNQLKYDLKVYHNSKAVTVSKNYSLNAGSIEILGYFKSPVEDRILIILQYSNMGCMEYDHFADIIMVGCELNPKWWD